MIESCVVIGMDGKPIYWHLPDNRSSAYIPDSQDLWDILWENRKVLKGVAHTHPWLGSPQPSHTDVTTFAAVETGLGVRLSWWVVTFNKVALATWKGPDRLGYDVQIVHPDGIEKDWVEQLRQHSR